MDIAIALLQRYSFDLGGYTIRDLQKAWGRFKPEWPRQATIEALFQGRYKAVSVNQILELWERKGEPQHRYNREFERLVCDDVAVNYEDRIFYKSPPARTEPLTAISPLSLSQPQSQSPPELLPPWLCNWLVAASSPSRYAARRFRPPQWHHQPQYQ